MSSKKQNLIGSAILNSDLEAQREYAERMKSQGFDFSLMVAVAFVRGIRDIGYKSTATALDELIDNSIQAGATNIHVVFGYDGKSTKPVHIAVIDDGHGMDPDMIRLAIVWGGTHREDNREGFGRYGYGLPSASISQGRRFEVYSIVEGGQFHKGWLDLDEIQQGDYTNSEGRIIVPEPVPAKLPTRLKEHTTHKPFGAKGIAHGTVVVLDKLDRPSWKTQDALERNLLEHFGVVYRNYLREVNIYVAGKAVEPTDPLFVTEGYRFYDLDEDRAEPLEPMMIEVKDCKGEKQLAKVRFSYMPPTFGRVPEEKLNPKGKNNARFAIMKEYNSGIIMLRNGRQIDVVTRCPWVTFENNDRYWGVEINFPAALDEEFSITTSKQQVVLSERMWDALKQAGVWKAIQQFRRRYDEDVAKLKDKSETAPKRPSERAMEEAEKFKTKRPGDVPPEQKAKSEQRFKEEVNKRAKAAGIAPEKIEEEVRQETTDHPYKVQTESMPGAPFFRVEQIGGQKVLYLNTAHRFYTSVYAGSESTPYLRAALDVMLFVIGDCELDAEAERRLFYETERAEWSKRLSVTLDRLEQFINATEKTSDNNNASGKQSDSPQLQFDLQEG